MTEDEEIMDLAMIMTASERHDTNAYKARNRVEELLKEDAHERKYYKALVTNYAHQIIELWCLIDYSKSNAKLKEQITRWKTELFELMVNTAVLKIKEDNSLANRKSAVAEVWDAEDYSNDIKVIEMTVDWAFRKVGFYTDSDDYIRTINNCYDASSDIIDAIASGNKDTIRNYVYGL